LPAKQLRQRAKLPSRRDKAVPACGSNKRPWASILQEKRLPEGGPVFKAIQGHRFIKT
jgi:hypothetical protein